MGYNNAVNPASPVSLPNPLWAQLCVGRTGRVASPRRPVLRWGRKLRPTNADGPLGDRTLPPQRVRHRIDRDR